MADETSDAVAREAAWLARSGDGLPALLKSDGGLWDVVQAYWPGDRLASEMSAIYVTRSQLDDDHPSVWRYRPRHIFRLKLVWPVNTAASPPAETEQQTFDDPEVTIPTTKELRATVTDYADDSEFSS